MLVPHFCTITAIINLSRRGRAGRAGRVEGAREGLLKYSIGFLQGTRGRRGRRRQNHFV
jgi:hypothetical protein